MNNTTICQHAKSEWGEPILIEGLQQGVNTELTKHNCINSQKCGYCHCCGVESFLDSPFVGNIIYHGNNNRKWKYWKNNQSQDRGSVILTKIKILTGEQIINTLLLMKLYDVTCSGNACSWCTTKRWPEYACSIHGTKEKQQLTELLS